MEGTNFSACEKFFLACWPHSIWPRPGRDWAVWRATGRLQVLGFHSERLFASCSRFCDRGLLLQKTRQDKTDTCDVLCFADLKLVTCFGRFALCRMAPGPSKSGDIRRAEGFRYHVRCGGGRVNEPVSLCFPRKPCLQGSRGMFSCCHVHATSAMAQALLVSPSSLASLTAWSLRNKWILWLCLPKVRPRLLRTPCSCW